MTQFQIFFTPCGKQLSVFQQQQQNYFMGTNTSLLSYYFIHPCQRQLRQCGSLSHTVQIARSIVLFHWTVIIQRFFSHLQYANFLSLSSFHHWIFSQSTLNILTNKGKHHYPPTNITPFSVSVFKHLVPHLLITLVRKNILAII